MRGKVQREFDAFERAARSEELEAESLLPAPGLLGSLDMQFEDARATELREYGLSGGLAGLATQESAAHFSRLSLGEKIKSNRFKQSQSIDF